MTSATVEETAPTEAAELSEAVKSEVLTHFAKCLECARAVKFRPSESGAGFMLIDADPDAVFGVSANGLPLCPNGHGEMSIADESLPAADAFAAVSDRLNEAKQRTLPGCLPAFNYEAAAREMTQQAVSVQALKRIYDDDAAKAKASKKRWEDGEELLTNIGLRFAERIASRDSGLESDDPPAPERAPCTWEAKYPTLRACPICTGLTAAAVIERLIGAEVPPADAAAHADSVEALLLGLELDELEDTLPGVDLVIARDVIAGWSEDDRAAVLKWAVKSFEHASGVPDTVVPERPAILGKPHIPSQAMPGEHQVCSMCEVVIRPASEIEADGPYKLTDLVGVDCAGKVRKVGHHYPKTSKKKPAAKKKASR